MTEPQTDRTEPPPQTLAGARGERALDAPRVGIIMGSQSDMDTMQGAAKVLEEAGIRHEMRVMSAHRDPEQVADYCRNARLRGLQVIIARVALSARRCPASRPHTPTCR